MEAVFITGFNNWGKTTIIQDLFSRQKFHHGWTYIPHGVNSDFTVESHSNDDWWGQIWVERLRVRINNERKQNVNLLTALCPTMEIDNNFVQLLSNAPFTSYSRLHIFLIEYKWEHHAQLLLQNIINAGNSIPNANFITVNADINFANDLARREAKVNQIRQELARIFP